MLRVAVPGAAGKMGRTIVRVLAETAGVTLAAALERPDHPGLGQDAGVVAGLGAAGVLIGHEVERALDEVDVVIDFTAPASTAWIASRAAAREVALVVGTTGLGETERQAVERAAEE